MRPKSIREFELVFFASIAIGLIGVIFGWNTMMAKLAANPNAAVIAYGKTIAIGSIAFGYALWLLLYYFIAHRGAVVAKWIFVVLEGLGLLGAAFSLLRQTVPHGVVGVLTVAGWVLSIVMIWLLFRPDTKAWFGETGTAADNEGEPA